ncbi:hypothetical protein OUZ56_003424 [Daphnia magna]|uniref:SWIM-type domain-containing protein n=1 Tax=Daphnia magna TaxID=35525 RepID=A0ABR0A8X2_9CRUS|nr:hypothetical protein OUZ56_003424 [Daphnia magna]
MSNVSAGFCYVNLENNHNKEVVSMRFLPVCLCPSPLDQGQLSPSSSYIEFRPQENLKMNKFTLPRNYIWLNSFVQQFVESFRFNPLTWRPKAAMPVINDPIDHERMLSCQVWKRSKISIRDNMPEIITALICHHSGLLKSWPLFSFVAVMAGLATNQTIELYRLSPYVKELVPKEQKKDAEQYVSYGWVKDGFSAKLPNSVVIVTCRVHHSQSIRKSLLNPWAAIARDLSIICSSCDCEAELGETCSHVGAMLYKIIAVNSMHKLFKRLSGMNETIYKSKGRITKSRNKVYDSAEIPLMS